MVCCKPGRCASMSHRSYCMTEIISGKHAVLELLRAKKRKCYEVLIAQGKKEKIVTEIEEAAQKISVPVRHLRIEEIASITNSDKHQGVAARADSFSFSLLADVLNQLKTGDRNGFIVILDGILDPQNLGSLIRTSHLCGVDALILPKDNSAPVSPAAVKASSGASEYLPIVEITNIVATLKDLKDFGFWAVGAVGESDKNLYQFDFTGNNYVLVLGGEGKGIRRLVKENCDFLLSIPMFGKISSYNVSVAGAIFMSEVMRQRLFKNYTNNQKTP